MSVETTHFSIEVTGLRSLNGLMSMKWMWIGWYGFPSRQILMQLNTHVTFHMGVREPYAHIIKTRPEGLYIRRKVFIPPLRCYTLPQPWSSSQGCWSNHNSTRLTTAFCPSVREIYYKAAATDGFIHLQIIFAIHQWIKPCELKVARQCPRVSVYDRKFKKKKKNN